MEAAGIGIVSVILGLALGGLILYYYLGIIREDMEKRGGTAMIPTKRNRLIQLPVDAAIYALRNMVERCFNKLKQCCHPLGQAAR